MRTERHYADEWLIALADGELAWCDRYRIRLHLAGCWQCRLRLKELEEAVLTFTRAVRNYELDDPFRVVDARLRFEERVRARERCPKPCMAPAPRRGTVFAAVATAVVVILLVLRPQLPWPASAPGERDVLRKIEAAERPITEQLIRQALQLEIVQLRPERRQLHRELEIAADPRTARFEATLRSEDGRVRHALWRPEAGKEIYYDSVLHPRPSAFTRVGKHPGLPGSLFGGHPTLQDIERNLIQWLEERSWTPVSLAHVVSVFAAEDGTSLAVERTPEDETSALRLVVRRTHRGATLEVILETDPTTFRPLLQTIRWSGATGEYEVRFRPVGAANPRFVTFQPDPEIYPARTVSSRFQQPAPPLTAVAPAPDVPSPEPEPPAQREISVLYALHRVRACLGEPVGIIPAKDGSFLVRGVVRDDGRKEQILASLAAIPQAPWLAAELSTTAEVFVDLAGSASPPVSIVVPPTASAALARIEAYYQGRATDPKREARAFHDAALKRAGALLGEALALQKLRALRQAVPGRPFDSETERLLVLMVRDHARALDVQARGLYDHLLPVLHAVFPRLMRGPVERGEGARSPEGIQPPEPAALVRDIYEVQNRLFAIQEDLPAGEREAGWLAANLARLESWSQNLVAGLPELP